MALCLHLHMSQPSHSPVTSSDKRSSSRDRSDISGQCACSCTFDPKWSTFVWPVPSLPGGSHKGSTYQMKSQGAGHGMAVVCADEVTGPWNGCRASVNGCGPIHVNHVAVAS